MYIEGRYNYEDLETGSLFAGATVAVGEDPWLELTSMLGGVVGRTSGVAPAYRVAAGYGMLDVYSEGEYLIAGEAGDDLFYAWSEIAVSPLEWLRVGLSGQRTRLYQTELDIQRGPLVGLAWGPASLITYVFNVGWESPTVVMVGTVVF